MASPAWGTIYEKWQSYDVPAIEIVEFLPGGHYPNFPWRERHSRTQFTTGNPANQTAEWLCQFDDEGDNEAYSALKILSFCQKHPSGIGDDIQYGAKFRLGVSHPQQEFWAVQASNVVPAVKLSFHSKELDTWRGVIKLAAQTWTEISETHAIIRIPYFMDPESAEFQEWEQYQAALNEQNELRQFQRLSAKFDDKGL